MTNPSNKYLYGSYRKKLAAIFLIILAFAIVAEIGSRIFLGLGNPPLYISHPTIEYLMAPDQDVHRFGNRTIVNHQSMRSREIPPLREGQFKVLVFGDSVINGGVLTDHSELATTLLEARLKGCMPNVDVFVANISTGSWGPGNWLQYAREFGFFHADCLVLVVSSHDHADNPTFEPLDKTSYPTQKPWSAIGEAISRYLPRLVNFVAGTRSD